MSYAFTKLLQAQASFEARESSFLKFLSRITSLIIKPFRDSNNKYNLKKDELHQINLIFDSINKLYKFHNDSLNKLYNNNHNNTVSSSPPRGAQPSSHNRYHIRSSSPNLNSIITQQNDNLNVSIFLYYREFPLQYSIYFNNITKSLIYLSNITRAYIKFKKDINSKVEIIKNINNDNKYQTFAQLLADIFQHSRDQSNALTELANCKYLKKNNEAKKLKQNLSKYLEAQFRKYELIQSKLRLLSLEMYINNLPIQLYNDDRRLLYQYLIDLPSKAKSMKNLFGSSKTGQQKTREGILHIYNDMILIRTVEGKFKGCYEYSSDDMHCILSGASIIFSHGNNDKKPLPIYMKKSGIPDGCQQIYQQIGKRVSEYRANQQILKAQYSHPRAKAKKLSSSAASSDDYVLSRDDIDFGDNSSNNTGTPQYAPNNNIKFTPNPISISHNNNINNNNTTNTPKSPYSPNSKSHPIPIASNTQHINYAKYNNSNNNNNNRILNSTQILQSRSKPKSPSPHNIFKTYLAHQNNNVFNAPQSKSFDRLTNSYASNDDINFNEPSNSSNPMKSRSYPTPNKYTSPNEPVPSASSNQNKLDANTRYNSDINNRYSMYSNKSLAYNSSMNTQQRQSMYSITDTTITYGMNDLSEPRTSLQTIPWSIHTNSIRTPNTSKRMSNTNLSDDNTSNINMGGYPDLFAKKYSDNVPTPISETSIGGVLPFTTPQKTISASTHSSINDLIKNTVNIQPQSKVINDNNTGTNTVSKANGNNIVVILENKANDNILSPLNVSRLNYKHVTPSNPHSITSKANDNNANNATKGSRTYEYSQDTLNSDLLDPSYDSDRNNPIKYDTDDDDEDDMAKQQEKIEKFKLYRTNSLRDGRRSSLPSMLSSIASSGKQTIDGSTDDPDGVDDHSKSPISSNHNSHNSSSFNKPKHTRQRSKSFGNSNTLHNKRKQVTFKNTNSINSNYDHHIIKPPFDNIPNEDTVFDIKITKCKPKKNQLSIIKQINTDKNKTYDAINVNDASDKDGFSMIDDDDDDLNDVCLTDNITSKSSTASDLSDLNNNNSQSPLNAIYQVRKELNEHKELEIFDENDVFIKNDIQTDIQERLALNKKKYDKKNNMAPINLNKAASQSSSNGSPSPTDVDDPYRVFNMDPNANSFDDNDVARNILFAPSWHDKNSPPRQYSQLHPADYYQQNRQVLKNTMQYSVDHFKHQLEKEKEKNKNDNDDDHDDISSVTMVDKPKIKPCIKHPFQMFLNDMHKYGKDANHPYVDDDDDNQDNDDNKGDNDDKKYKISTTQHNKHQSTELMIWDENNQELTDLNGDKLKLNSTSSNYSINSLQAGPVPSGNDKLPRINSINSLNSNGTVSTLGTSPSVIHNRIQKADLEKRKQGLLSPINAKKERTLENETEIEWDHAVPTTDLLRSFAMQVDNSLLLQEVQRLKDIVKHLNIDIDLQDKNINTLNESIHDKNSMINSLRRTVNIKTDNISNLERRNETLKRKNHDLENANFALNLKVKAFQNKNNKKNKKDNTNNTNNSAIDDGLIPGRPTMLYSVSDDKYISTKIAPELINNYKQYTSASKSPPSGNNGNNFKKLKKKSKVFTRPKQQSHSLSLSIARRQHMNKLRNSKLSQSGHNSTNTTGDDDKLKDVKNKINSMKSMKVKLASVTMQQSSTKYTPQHTPTPGNGYAINTGHGAGASTTSSITSIPPYSNNYVMNISRQSSHDMINHDPVPSLSIYGPVSAPIDDNHHHHNQSSPFIDKIPSIIDINKTKSSPTTENNNSNHTRKDTPTPNTKNKNSSYKWLKTKNNNNNNPSTLLLNSKNGIFAKSTPHLPLKQINSGSQLQLISDNNNNNSNYLSSSSSTLHSSIGKFVPVPHIQIQKDEFEDDDFVYLPDNTSAALPPKYNKYKNNKNNSLTKIKQKPMRYAKSSNISQNNSNSNNNSNITKSYPLPASISNNIGNLLSKSYNDKEPSPSPSPFYNHSDIPTPKWARAHSKSFSAKVTKKKRRSGSIGQLNRYNKNKLKNRTNNNNNKYNKKSKYKHYPKTPKIKSSNPMELRNRILDNNNNNNSNKPKKNHKYTKRRSLYIKQTNHHLKSRVNNKKISKSPSLPAKSGYNIVDEFPDIKI